MKRSILLLMAVLMAVFFVSCEKEEILPPDVEQDNLEQAALKCAKEKDKRSFEGICTPLDFAAGLWYDATDDWRVTGTTLWAYNETGTGGTTILTVDAKNPHEENRGIWEMEWEFVVMEPTYLVATATGIGVSGKVKGLKANWTYTFNYTGPLDGPPEFPFDITHPSFRYEVEGFIEKPQGHNKHKAPRHRGHRR